jgi:3-hydroxybutyryl-CoA dehydratase
MNEYSFDQLPIGKQEMLNVTITDSDIDRFAAFSGDCSTIHMDNEYAASRRFKARISHGLLVSSYVSALLGMKLPGKHGLLQSINCHFRAPCYAPNVLTIVGTVKSRSEAIKVVNIGITVTDQDGMEIMRAEANSVLKF